MLAETFERLGHSVLAQHVRDGKKFQRFEFCLFSADIDLDTQGYFWPLFRALLSICGDSPACETWDEWKAYALRPENYGLDDGVKKLRALV